MIDTERTSFFRTQRFRNKYQQPNYLSPEVLEVTQGYILHYSDRTNETMNYCDITVWSKDLEQVQEDKAYALKNKSNYTELIMGDIHKIEENLTLTKVE